jgi:NAD(P)-dependent dehydrogenase (short-subunit alcohol dehydrogenase family)
MQAPLFPELSQLNALVVGATQGIGLGFVKSLLTDLRVKKIFCTYRKAETAGELCALKEQEGERLVLLPMDVTNEFQIADAVESIKETCRELHLVLYCAGVLHEGALSPEKSLRHLKAQHLLYSFQVNSIGAVLLAKHLVPFFKRDKPSLFASISAKVGSIGDNRLGGWYGYRASKAALNMFMKTTAIEFGRRCPKTIVVALHPGTTDTRLSRPFQGNVPPEQLFPVEHTVNLLLGVMAKLGINDSGCFYSWNGSKLPW